MTGTLNVCLQLCGGGGVCMYGCVFVNTESCEVITQFYFFTVIEGD